ncbi:MAG: RDD family protein [Nitrospinota bacterium]|nr:RDD family protein [Nitrospinota bacterium]
MKIDSMASEGPSAFNGKVVEEKPYSINLAYAGFLSRFIAFAVDLMIIAIFLNIVIPVAGLFVTNIHGDGALGGGYILISMLFSNAVFVAYFTWFHTETGMTPGKRLLGIRVVGQFSAEVGISRALFRSLGYYLSFFPFFAGFLWVFISPTAESWHDKLAGTAVVESD